MESNGVYIIGFFRNVFEAFMGLVKWVNTPIVFEGWSFVLNPTQEQITEAVKNGAMTPLNLLSVLLVGFLTIVMALHIWHLVKPIG